MFNKLHIRLGPIAALICLSSLGFSGRREIKPPLREIDVAQKSAPYRTSLGMIVKNVQLAFLGEDRLAVMSQDDLSFPESGTARKKLHLTVDVFSLNSSDAHNFRELIYETETADSRIAALPSGRMIVSVSQGLILLDEKLQVEATSSLNQVCAPQPRLADKEGYVVALLPASEDVAVVSVQPTANRLFPPKRPGHSCWFSTHDLHPIAQTEGFQDIHATARDLLMYTGSPGSKSVSPSGVQRLTIAPSLSCNVNEVDTKFPVFVLLHAEEAAVFRCRKGVISLARGNQITEIAMKGGDSWGFQADAWKAPVAIFAHSGVYRPELGRYAMGKYIERIVNYRSGISAELPPPKPAIYRGRYLAISPSGRRFAALTGPLLSVFETPAEILETR